MYIEHVLELNEMSILSTIIYSLFTLLTLVLDVNVQGTKNKG